MQSVLSQFIAYLESIDLSYRDYQDLHHWSINEIGPFWESIATFFNIPEIPYTISGKKIEAPIKRILMGAEVDQVISKDSLRDPTAIDYFKKFKNFILS